MQADGEYRDIYANKFIASNMFTFHPVKGLDFSVGNSLIYDGILNPRITSYNVCYTKLLRIICIGNYPPRQCGIATFTENLLNSVLLAAKQQGRKIEIGVAAMTDRQTRITSYNVCYTKLLRIRTFYGVHPGDVAGLKPL